MESNADQSSPTSKRIRHFIANNFSYYSLRITFFVVIGMVGAILLFVIEQDLKFVDCMFMSYSAITNTGLKTVEPANWKAGSQIVLLLMILIGSQVLLTTLPVIIRRQYFRQGYHSQFKTAKGHRKEAEYQALGLVNYLTFWIFCGVQTVGALILGLYMAFVPSKKHLCARAGINPWWFAAFHTVSAFNNAGLVLLPNNLVQFHDDRFVVLFTIILTLLGNTGYPIFLRTVVSLYHKRHPSNPGLKYLLKFPRKCSTHLFPPLQTTVIALSIALFTFTMFVAFVSLNESRAFPAQTSTTVQSMVGFFQAVATRTSGFYLINISLVAPAMHVLYLVMMYVSNYPIISAVSSSSAVIRDPGSVARKVNNSPSQELSLGVSPVSSGGDSKSQNPHHLFTKLHLNMKGDVRETFSHIKVSLLADSGLLIAALFAICIAENDAIRKYDTLSPFDVLFEITSAFGTVGLSTGFERSLFSLSRVFSVFSKVVMMMVMIAGRQRGLPHAVDSVVNLPHLFNVAPGRSPIAGYLRLLASPNKNFEATSRSPATHEIDVPTFELSPAVATSSNPTRIRVDLVSPTSPDNSPSQQPQTALPQHATLRKTGSSSSSGSQGASSSQQQQPPPNQSNQFQLGKNQNNQQPLSPTQHNMTEL